MFAKSARRVLVIAAILTATSLLFVVTRAQTPPGSKGGKSVNQPVAPRPMPGAQTGKKPGTPPYTKPGSGPATGRFRITLNGFTCVRPTMDDPLQRDGVDDEVFLETAVLLFDGRTVIDQPAGAHSLTIGDTNNQPGRIRGGSGHNLFGGNGGFKDDDSFPTAQPWVHSSPLSNDRPPILLWEGDLTSGANGLVVVPTIWESDNRPDDLTGQWLNGIGDVQGMADELNGLFTDPAGQFFYDETPPPEMAASAARWRGRWVADQNRIEEKFKARMVAQDINSNNQDRPIGMHSIGGNKFEFRPQAYVMTYEFAHRIAHSNTDWGEGVLKIDYVENDLRTGYSLYMQIEQLR